MSVGAEREEHHSSMHVKETLEKHLKQNTWGKKNVQRVLWDKCHTGNAGNHELHGKLFPSFASIEFSSTELYVYYSQINTIVPKG